MDSECAVGSISMTTAMMKAEVDEDSLGDLEVDEADLMDNLSMEEPAEKQSEKAEVKSHKNSEKKS